MVGAAQCRCGSVLALSSDELLIVFGGVSLARPRTSILLLESRERMERPHIDQYHLQIMMVECSGWGCSRFERHHCCLRAQQQAHAAHDLGSDLNFLALYPPPRLRGIVVQPSVYSPCSLPVRLSRGAAVISPACFRKNCEHSFRKKQRRTCFVSTACVSDPRMSARASPPKCCKFPNEMHAITLLAPHVLLCSNRFCLSDKKLESASWRPTLTSGLVGLLCGGDDGRGL